MTTNIQGTRPTTPPADRIPDQTTERMTDRAVEPTPTPVVAPMGLSGVAVYDRDVDRLRDPGAPVPGTRVPAETRSTASVLNWILGAIVLIVVAYFLIQLFF